MNSNQILCWKSKYRKISNIPINLYGQLFSHFNCLSSKDKQSEVVELFIFCSNKPVLKRHKSLFSRTSQVVKSSFQLRIRNPTLVHNCLKFFLSKRTNRYLHNFDKARFGLESIFVKIPCTHQYSLKNRCHNKCMFPRKHKQECMDHYNLLGYTFGTQLLPKKILQ